MTINHQIRDEKLQYDINREAAKTIEDQGVKQIKSIQDHGKLKTIKKYDYDDEDTPVISKQKEIFIELVDEKREKITDLDEKVNNDDLIYRYKDNLLM